MEKFGYCYFVQFNHKFIPTPKVFKLPKGSTSLKTLGGQYYLPFLIKKIIKKSYQKFCDLIGEVCVVDQIWGGDGAGVHQLWGDEKCWGSDQLKYNKVRVDWWISDLKSWVKGRRRICRFLHIFTYTNEGLF